MAKGTLTRKRGVTRRKFLQYSAGAGALLAAGPLLRLPGSAHAAKKPRLKARTYLFNLSHMDTRRHDLILVAGKQRVKLKQMTPAVLKKARQDHPILQYVPDADLTHHLALDMPEDAIQLCYLQRVERGKKDGSWDMAHLFYHLPVSALLHARQLALLQAGNGLPKVPVKWQRYGITPEILVALNDPVGEAMLQDTTDQATAMVAGHPELASGEPNSAAYIQTNIIGTQPSTQELSQVIAAQGPATTGGGWATQTPLINPDTGQQATNSQGQLQYMPVWSQETGQFAGQAISPALDTVKDDTTLGANVTTIDPTAITNNDPTAPTNGAIWMLQDGQATVDQSLTSGVLQATELLYQFTNQSPGHGYSLDIEEVGIDSAGNRTITFSAKNWFVRYLSLYVRYLDGNNQPIALSAITAEIESGFPNWSLGFNGAYDAFLDMVNPEFEVIGIPSNVADIKSTIPVPQEAASVLILGGGLGSGDNPYSDSLPPGVAFTATFNLAVPALLLSLAAAAGYASLTGELEDASTLQEMLEEVVPWFTAFFQFDMFANPDVFIDLALEIGQQLLTTGGRKWMS